MLLVMLKYNHIKPAVIGKSHTQLIVNRFVYWSRKNHAISWRYMRAKSGTGYFNITGDTVVQFIVDNVNDSVRVTYHVRQSFITRFSLDLHPRSLQDFVFKLLQYRIIDYSPVDLDLKQPIDFKRSHKINYGIVYNLDCDRCKKNSPVLHPKAWFGRVLRYCHKCILITPSSYDSIN